MEEHTRPLTKSTARSLCVRKEVNPRWVLIIYAKQQGLPNFQNWTCHTDTQISNNCCISVCCLPRQIFYLFLQFLPFFNCPGQGKFFWWTLKQKKNCNNKNRSAEQFDHDLWPWSFVQSLSVLYIYSNLALRGPSCLFRIALQGNSVASRSHLACSASAPFALMQIF